MIRYEILLLSVPEITTDEAKSIQDNFEQILNDNKALVISFERWGKYRLSYPVKKNDYGIYFLIRFEVGSPEKLQKLLNDISMLIAVKLNELVMRYVICKLNPKTPLSYHRPESLEEAPGSNIDNILKEKKNFFHKKKHFEEKRAESEDFENESEDIEPETQKEENGTQN